MKGRTLVQQVACLWIAAVVVWSSAGGDALAAQRGAPDATSMPRGIRVKTDGALAGYTLFAPLTGDTTYLIDMDGQVVRTWKSDYVPSGWVNLLDNGHVIRGANDAGDSGFSGGGQGGRIQEWDFDGNLVWDFAYNDDRLTHHDTALLPNGNVLAIAWERKTPEEARRAGRREDLVPQRGLWPGMLVEFAPQPPDSTRIVWEWRSWDHLIQDLDPTLDNYGDPATHPEKINFNGDQVGAESPPENPSSDLFHFNGVDYNPQLDQIILSSPNFNELWVIDHSTTMGEAGGSSGGRSGKGGDLLYRWGNPQTYGRGTPDDQRFGFEHDTRWVKAQRPGEGNMTVFSNRTPGPDGGTFTMVYELVPPIDEEGHYTVPASGPFGPDEPVWTYSDPETFSATYISGAERLVNGNTMITSGPQGRMFEVAPDGEIVWEYWSPFRGTSNTGGGGGAANPYSIFKAQRIPLDHPGVAGRNLAPLDPQPPLLSPEE